jgi:uncharacterized coiled-coil DUF342 family protein
MPLILKKSTVRSWLKRERGKIMRYLEELEQKVLRLIQRNQELQTRLDTLTKECEKLREQNKQFENYLTTEAHTTQSLEQEKAAIVNSIEALLKSIDALENNAG